MTFDEVVTILRAAGCVWAEDEARLLLESGPDLPHLLERRAGGEPLELVLGWAEFRGLRVKVTPGVFVPRRRTEFLAGQAISAAAGQVVVELCCGTAAISVAVQHETEPAQLHVSDIDPAATALAAVNLDGTAHLYTGDLFDPLPRTLRDRVGVLVANVPYVPTADIPFLPAESRLHEPDVTVDGGDDGLTLFRRLVTGATSWLAPGGRVMSEVSARQAPLAQQIVAGQGLRAEMREDEDRGAVVVIGVRDPGT
ncbi:putative protein N(5)-glutamine methyltransferase [Kineosporia succinea]|uniref:Release factor glutamine methyltransferase n=1 Tax=Kineosporia succinea TaxID=84632 RepID=A0ABT9P2H2_9ACTN|nr:putative protein N(5)-glutamine methyltransferase [Kineosporia succinea]MDP9826883.1 release factor glutamine methyltransferase [Kineosporia succinea]